MTDIGKAHRNPEGFVDVHRKPTMSFRRKIGVIAIAGIGFFGIAHTADIIHSELVTLDTAPKLAMAEGSIPCSDAGAMVVVYSGYGIQNSEHTAWRISSLANEQNMCTQWVDNGTDIDIDLVRDAVVSQADANGIDNIVSVGESVGGIEAAHVINSTVEEFGDKYKFPALLADSTPADKTTLKWVNPSLAEKVAENCQYLKLGDFAMTVVTLLTDQNNERRNNFWKYWEPVYSATRSASMRLRTAQSCMAGAGFPRIDSIARTHVYYARNSQSHGDPIVDVEQSERAIRDLTEDGLFHEIHMDGSGINHASPWDNWGDYEPYYRGIMERIGAVIDGRQHNNGALGRKTTENQTIK